MINATKESFGTKPGSEEDVFCDFKGPFLLLMWLLDSLGLFGLVVFDGIATRVVEFVG